MNVSAGETIRLGLDHELTVTSRTSTGSVTFSSPAPPGSHAWYARDHDRALSLARSAYSNTSSPSVQSEACYLIARVNHARTDWQAAAKFYKQSVKLDRSFPPALYGYASLLVRQKEYVTAAGLLEAVLRSCPRSADALGLYGSVMCKDRGARYRKKALDNLRRAVSIRPGDAAMRRRLADVLKDDVGGFGEAIGEYERGMDLGEEREVEGLVNLGVMHFWRKDWEKAEGRWIEACGMLGSEWNGGEFFVEVVFASRFP